MIKSEAGVCLGFAKKKRKKRGRRGRKKEREVENGMSRCI